MFQDRLGGLGANLIALTATTLGNTWANRRYTFGRRGPRHRLRHYLGGTAIFAGGLALSSAGLVAADAIGAGCSAAPLRSRWPGRSPAWRASHSSAVGSSAMTTLAEPDEDRSEAADSSASGRGLPRAASVKLLRSLSVGGFTTVLSLGTLAVLTGFSGVPAAFANVLATALGTVPSYLLNRRWVWARSGRGDLRREVLPFWAISQSGLVLSTLAVAGADRVATAADWSGAVRSLALVCTNGATFAGLFLAQFLLLDRVLFGRPHSLDDAPR